MTTAKNLLQMRYTEIQCDWRLGWPYKPSEPKPSLRVPPITSSNLSDGLESDGNLQFPHNSIRVRGFNVRKPRGTASHARQNEMRQNSEVRNLGGCNAAKPIEQRSDFKSLATEGFIPAWRLRPGVSDRPIRVAYSVARMGPLGSVKGKETRRPPYCL